MVANVTVRQLTPIDAIANSYTARLAELNPILATEAGIAGHDHQLGFAGEAQDAALDWLAGLRLR